MVYLLTVLPTPTKQIVDCLEKKFTDFCAMEQGKEFIKKQLAKNIEEGECTTDVVRPHSNGKKIEQTLSPLRRRA